MDDLDGIENLKAILADQPYMNSALSVFEIDTILKNEGGFTPNEAVLWFREWRGRNNVQSMSLEH